MLPLESTSASLSTSPPKASKLSETFLPDISSNTALNSTFSKYE